MDVHLFDTETDLLLYAQSIQRESDSGKAWLCAKIHDDALTELNDNKELLNCAHAVMKDYFKDLKGRLFYVNKTDLYIFTNSVSKDTLNEIGRHLCDLILMENTAHPEIRIFKLSQIDTNPDETMLHDWLSNDEELVKATQKRLQNNIADHEVEKKIAALKEKPRVLLVDDDALTRLMVRTALKDSCTLETVSGAANTKMMYESFRPNVVFLDIGLPDGDGQSLLTDILGVDKDAYIVMFSGRDDVNNIAQSIDNGARGFIAKPFIKNRLLQYILDSVSLD